MVVLVFKKQVPLSFHCLSGDCSVIFSASLATGVRGGLSCKPWRLWGRMGQGSGCLVCGPTGGKGHSAQRDSLAT